MRNGSIRSTVALLVCFMLAAGLLGQGIGGIGAG
ncbi:hypothetical protein Theco_0693 [Thermobacillus composti KWC4]|uniref:Uncharacterized protein n=1 Tax=Thermobacillus composti (strain DSM 18247 / JCM 13945 / KWC4) TaxID=717605 RepID=L0ECL9_THECK|nr:hypothetical protein Theco_0693 [Thermobacillus composti KWC4]